MTLETQKTIISPAEKLYYATTKEELTGGYTALEEYARSGHLSGALARRLMEVERQTLRTKQAVEVAGAKLETWKHQRLERAVDQLWDMFKRHGHEMPGELREFKYGFRIRIRPYKVIRYERRRRGAEWKSGENNVAVVLAYTDQVLREISDGRSTTLSGGHTA